MTVVRMHWNVRHQLGKVSITCDNVLFDRKKKTRSKYVIRDTYYSGGGLRSVATQSRIQVIAYCTLIRVTVKTQFGGSESEMK